MSTTPSNEIEDSVANSLTTDFSAATSLDQMQRFHNALANNLNDGVCYLDREGKIIFWSHRLESMTGLNFAHTSGLQFAPSLLSLCNTQGEPFNDNLNPVVSSLETGDIKSFDSLITGKSGRQLKVEVTTIPVIDNQFDFLGGVILLKDTSAHFDLQKQLNDLYSFSMRDPLTKVANRAEFERVLEEYVRLHHSSDFKCSIIICDIDFFKQINDNFNHHIGDQALVAFANILKEFVRSEDLVARYGGEEFILLCAHCDKESAVERAEEIRKHLANTPQPMLNGKCITASFGVAELRESESATEFFVRADNALLHAKESGRNRVIESESLNSSAPSNQETPNPSLAGIQWRTIKGSNLFCEEYITEMPISVLVEKLRGFILETHADIQHVAPEFASLTCDFEDPGNYSRKGVFMVDIEFHERELLDNEASVFGTGTRSFIRITIREGKRKWFATNCTDLAPNLAYEIRQFLMITQSNAIGVEPHATESTR